MARKKTIPAMKSKTPVSNEHAQVIDSTLMRLEGEYERAAEEAARDGLYSHAATCQARATTTTLVRLALEAAGILPTVE